MFVLRIVLFGWRLAFDLHPEDEPDDELVDVSDTVMGFAIPVDDVDLDLDPDEED